jgi:hypothetical protein
LGVLVFASVALAVLLAAISGLLAADLRRQALTEARDTHLINVLREGVESRLAIGLSFEQLEALQPVIERERASSQEIVSIDIFSSAGVLAYSTDAGAVGRTEALGWVPMLAQSDLWRIDRPLERVVGTRVENDLGEPLGGIGVTIAEPSAGTSPVGELLALPDVAALGGLLAWMLLPAALGAWTAGLVLRRALQPYRQVVRGMAGLPVDGTEVGVMAAARHAQHLRAREVIAAGLRRLRELDDGA